MFVSDDFNRASIGPNWTTSPGAQPLATNGSACIPTLAGAHSSAWYNAIPFANNQLAEALLLTAYDWIGVVVRHQPTVADYYALYSFGTGPWNFALHRVQSGSAINPPLATSGAGFSPGSILRLSVIGTVLRATYGGTLLFTYDTSGDAIQLTGGAPGLDLSWDGGSLSQCDDFLAGDIADVAASVQTVEVEQFKPDIDVIVSQGNIQAGVKAYGYGLNVAFPIQAGVAYGATFPIQAGVAAVEIAPVVEPLVVHLGQGVMLFGFQHPNPTTVDHYELFYSSALTGPYEFFNSGIFTEMRGIVRNVSMNNSAFFRIEAVGKNGSRSTPVQVHQGKLTLPLLVNLKVRGIQGSQIKTGAMFPSVDRETGMTVLMRAYQDITLT